MLNHKPKKSLKMLAISMPIFFELTMAQANTLNSIDATTFPDHMISLFYDDGPDLHTIAPPGTQPITASANYLADYLSSKHVSATFAVVGSMQPSFGNRPYPTASSDGTGYLHHSLTYPNPYFERIVHLGHRLGNHTLNHIPLDGLFASELLDSYSDQSAPWANSNSNSAATIADGIRYQVDKAQSYISPYISNKLYVLIPPGGAWSATSEQAVAGSQSFLQRFDPNNSFSIGIFTFNVTASNSCGMVPSSTGTISMTLNAADWCYAQLGKPATQYSSDIKNAISSYTSQYAKGFYLINHDRNVGALGSTYALDIAKDLIPYLQQNGYVFVGPVINFSQVTNSNAFPDSAGWMGNSSYYKTFRSADVNGDGRADVCARGSAGIFCSLSQILPPAELGSSPSVKFGAELLWEGGQFTDAGGWGDARYASTMMLADVNADGKADLIARNGAGIVVALSNGGGFDSAQQWLTGTNGFSNSEIDLATGVSMWLEPSHYETFRAADVNGDGYADLCARETLGIVCAINNRSGGFAPYTLWEAAQFKDVGGWADTRYASTIMLADVNGDGRADLIARSSVGLIVYLSNGSGFQAPPSGSYWTSGANFSNTDTQNNIAMNWLTEPSRYQTFQAADINGDSKADICARGPAGIVCVLSTGVRFLKETNWEFASNPQFTDTNGWLSVPYASTIILGDTNGDNRADIIAKNSVGLINAFAP